MIRPATIMLLVLVAGAVGAVFFVSHEVAALDDRLRELNQNIEADYDALHVLRAEWSYLNQPQRLADLASRHLNLEPLSGIQMVRRQPPQERFVAFHIIDGTRPNIDDEFASDGPIAIYQPERRPTISNTLTAVTERRPVTQVQAAEIGELVENRPIDVIFNFIERVISIASARAEGGRQ